MFQELTGTDLQSFKPPR